MTDKIIYEPSPTKHWKTLFPQKNMLLGSHNLNPGEELVATITEILSDQTVKGENGREDKVVVIHFDKATKIPPMCLNITNAQTIAGMYGDQYDGWIGKAVQIFATEVKDFGGGTTTGLRIRGTIPATTDGLDGYVEQLRSCATMDDLAATFKDIPKQLKAKGTESAKVLNAVKDEMKGKVDA